MIEVIKKHDRRLANIRTEAKAIQNATQLSRTIEVVVMQETTRNQFAFGWTRAIENPDGSWMIGNHTGRVETRFNQTYELMHNSMRRWAKAITNENLVACNWTFNTQMIGELKNEWVRVFEPRPIDWHIALTLDLPQMRVQLVMDCNGDLSDDTEHKMQFDSRAEMYEFAYNFASNFEANQNDKDTVRVTHQFGTINGDDIKPRPNRQLADEISWNNLIARRPDAPAA